MIELDQFYKKILILEECTRAEVKIFQEYLLPILLMENEVLFNQNDPGTQLFIVKQGIIGCYTLLSDGSQRDVARFSPGKSFGEMAIVASIPRTTTCYAITSSELLVMEADDFKRLNEQYPEIGIKILKGMIRNMVAWLTDADDFLNSMCIWGEKARLRVITDEMTGLYNRRFFEESLEINITKSRQKKSPFCILMCDIDNFHSINNAIGFKAGDEVIKLLGKVIKSSFTGLNIPAKVGGDEFAVLLPGLSIQQAMTVSARFKSAFEAVHIKMLLKSELFTDNITISIGIAEFPSHGQTSSALKESADKALFEAKRAGKNCIFYAEKK